LVRDNFPHQRPDFDYDPVNDIILVKRPAAVFRVRIYSEMTDQSRRVEMRNGTLSVIPPSGHVNGIWQWELGPGFYKYGYPDGEPHFLELKGEGRGIDARL
jgi:hypothetical protein